MRARGLLLAGMLLLPLALLSACADDSPSSAADPVASESTTTTTAPPESETPTASASASASEIPDWPSCEEVWVADARIPVRYKGCLDGKTAVPADNLSCSSGQRIVRYEDHFFGVAGGLIYEAKGPLEKDKQYLKMIRVCRA